MCVYICLSPRPNENLVHTCVTPVNYIIDFFENVTLGVVSLKKLLVHLDFCISPLLFCQKVREALGDIHIFPHIIICVSVYSFICVTPDQTKNDTDLKLGTGTPLDHI